MSVFTSVRQHISKTNFINFCCCVTCGRGSIFLQRCCDTYCRPTSGFVDDAIFRRTGRNRRREMGTPRMVYLMYHQGRSRVSTTVLFRYTWKVTTNLDKSFTAAITVHFNWAFVAQATTLAKHVSRNFYNANCTLCELFNALDVSRL